MRSFDREFSQLLQDEGARKRVAPFLSDVFEVATLQRPTFAAEIGLEPGDVRLLKVGALGQSWLPTAAFSRALAEDLHDRKEKSQPFLDGFPSLDEKQQWILAQRVFLRMEQIVNAEKDRPKVASELQVALTELDGWRKRWKETMGQDDQPLSQAIQMRLLGIGLPSSKELLAQLDAQSHSTFLWAFQVDRPLLSKLSDEEIEVTVPLPSPLANGKEYLVRESLAKEIEQNAQLQPQLWGKQWRDYLSKHHNLSNPEFNALLDHLEQDGRNRWPDMIPGQGARALRAVSAVAVGMLEDLASADDAESIQRLFTLIENFSEHHEMKAVLKRRFGL